MNKTLGMNELINDSLKYLTCFISGWISIFEQISWMNDSKTNIFSHLSPSGGVTMSSIQTFSQCEKTPESFIYFNTDW